MDAIWKEIKFVTLFFTCLALMVFGALGYATFYDHERDCPRLSVIEPVESSS